MALDPLAPPDHDPWVEVESILTPFENLETLDPPVEHRRHARLVAPPCRPLPMQMLQADGAPRTEWFYADVLDISLGGACLLICDGHPLHVSDRLLLDLQAHLLAGPTLVSARVRWFVRSGQVITLGVGFDEPLQQCPPLLSERRHRLRDLSEPGSPG